MKTRVDIISGFLGAGKTTLIKKLIEGPLLNEKLVIIENEFGKVGIDGTLLKKSKAQVREINSGCICCTLMGNFEAALKEVIEQYKPERVIIEPSGVCRLTDVIRTCDSTQIKDLLTVNMLVVVADASKYQLHASNFNEFFENQIIGAKTIILSRTQNMDAGKLETVVSSIRKVNSAAVIVTTPWDVLGADALLAAAEHGAANSLEAEVRKVVLEKHSHPAGCECGCSHDHGHAHSHGHVQERAVGRHHCRSADEVFDVWSVETPRQFDENELRLIFGTIAGNNNNGLILRGKGIVHLISGKWIQFDYVPGEYDTRETGPDYTSRLCLIGTGLKKQELGRMFKITE